MRLRAALIAGCVAFLVVRGATPQSPAQSPQSPQSIPSFRAGVDLVVLDVSVLDGQRRPVRGLTAADFVVLEDGKPQKVATFSAVDLPEVSAEPAAADSMRDVAPDVQRNADSADPRLVILVMDDASPMRAEEVPRVKDYARRIIDKLGPRDLAAVVYTLDHTHGQNYTHDRRLLRRAVDGFAGGLTIDKWEDGHAVNVDYSTFDSSATTLYASAIATLQGVADSLAEQSQRRKVLFFISVGVPVSVTQMAPRPDIQHTEVDATGVAVALSHKLTRLIEVAARSNVNVYCIDPGGLRSPVSARSPSPSFAGASNADFLQALSTNTGGLATLYTNDPEPGIAQAFRENQSFYVLGYQPSNPRTERRLRRIEVRVNRPDVTVRARDGYFEPDRPQPAKGNPPSPLLTAMSGLLPKTEVELEATAAPFPIAGRAEATVAITLRVRQPMPAREHRVIENADVLVNAYEVEKGALRGTDRLKAAVALRPGEAGDVAYDVLSRLDLKPGRYQIRIAARSTLSGKSGSVYFDLDVPDFSRPGIAMSGVVLGGGPPVAVAPKDKLASLLPVVPTVTREFDPSDEVSAFFRVHQGGKESPVPVAVAVRVADSAGQIVFVQNDSLAATQFATARSADYRMHLPLARLQSGLYVLTAEVTSGKTSAQRDVPFRVR